MVDIGTKAGQYPLLRDTPQQGDDTILDFQVHVLYRTSQNQQTVIRARQGFQWKYMGNENNQGPVAKFISTLDAPSQNFMNCLNLGLQFQNNHQGTQWVLEN